MKIRKSVIIILIVTIILSFFWYQNKYNYSINLKTPNKINLYVDGKQKQITKSGDKYDQTFFDRINVLVNIRMPQEFSPMKGPVSESDIKEVKGYAVEFVYDKTQTVAINNGNMGKIQFTEIIFPLSEKWQNIALIRGKNNSYTPVVLKENLDYLVKSSFK